jgi:hypothetical protein
MYWTPGPDNSNLISTEKAVPISPENNAKIKYNVPISLALEDKNHRSLHIDIEDFTLEKLSTSFNSSFIDGLEFIGFKRMDTEKRKSVF